MRFLAVLRPSIWPSLQLELSPKEILEIGNLRTGMALFEGTFSLSIRIAGVLTGFGRAVIVAHDVLAQK